MYPNLLHSVTKFVTNRNNPNLIPHMIEKGEEEEEE